MVAENLVAALEARGHAHPLDPPLDLLARVADGEVPPDRYIDLVADGAPTEAAGEVLDGPTREFERLELLLRLRGGVPLDVLDGHAT